MKYCNFVSNFNKIHFVGVGGVSMSAICEYSKECGVSVSGSDMTSSNRTEKLKSLGCEIKIGHSSKNVRGADALVYTGATDDTNPEIRYAKKKRIPIFSRGEFLGGIISDYKNSVAVSGCHGKTTAMAMIANALIRAGKDPTVFLGGDDFDFGNFRLGNSDYLALEACEYKKSFLHFKPKIAVVLNVGDDHLDTYGNLDGIIDGFREFIGDSIAVVNADDENCKKVFNASTLTFGIENSAHYYATKIKFDGKFYSFVLNAYTKSYGRVKLKAEGRHNIYNALATFAVCDILGIPFDKIKNALENFNGIKRRNEYLGEKNGVKYFADYAHHPKELQAMIKVYDENKGEYITVFQPHTYSRTKYLMDDFVGVLKNQSPLIIYKTYPAREDFDADGSALKLYDELKNSGVKDVYYVNDEIELASVIERHAMNIDKVIIFGAGDIYEIVNSLLV